MREFAKIPSDFWVTGMGRQTKEAGSETQLIALYLLTNSHANMLGIYYLPITFIAFEIGLSLEGATQGLNSLIEMGFCSYDDFSQYLWVHHMAFDQISTQLKPNDNRVKAINQIYAALPDLPFLQAFHEQYADAFLLTACRKSQRYPQNFLETPSESLPSKEKDKKKEKKKKKIFMSSKLNSIFVEQEQPPVENKKILLLKSQAMEILQFLNEKTGRAYRPVETNLKLIIARLKSNATVMDCRQVIAKKTREWKGNVLMAEYLRPATLFNATKFEQYMGELVLPKED